MKKDNLFAMHAKINAACAKFITNGYKNARFDYYRLVNDAEFVEIHFCSEINDIDFNNEIYVPLKTLVPELYKTEEIWTIVTYDATSGAEVAEVLHDYDKAVASFREQIHILCDALAENFTTYKVIANTDNYFVLVTDKDNERYEIYLNKSFEF